MNRSQEAKTTQDDIATATKAIQHHRRIGSIIDDSDDFGDSTPQHQDQDGVSEVVAGLAKTCNKLVMDNFGLCTIYCDQQLQYELDQYNTTSGATTLNSIQQSPFYDCQSNQGEGDDNDSFRRL